MNRMYVCIYLWIWITAGLIWFSFIEKLLKGPGKVYKYFREGTSSAPWRPLGAIAASHLIFIALSFLYRSQILQNIPKERNIEND